MLKFFLEDGNYKEGEKWNKFKRGEKKTTWLGNTKVKKKKKRKKEEEKGKIAIEKGKIEIEKWGLKKKPHSLNLLSSN